LVASPAAVAAAPPRARAQLALERIEQLRDVIVELAARERLHRRLPGIGLGRLAPGKQDVRPLLREKVGEGVELNVRGLGHVVAIVGPPPSRARPESPGLIAPLPAARAEPW
jgi:hypothetical protein